MFTDFAFKRPKQKDAESVRLHVVLARCEEDWRDLVTPKFHLGYLMTSSILSYLINQRPHQMTSGLRPHDLMTSERHGGAKKPKPCTGVSMRVEKQSWFGLGHSPTETGLFSWFFKVTSLIS